MSGHQLTDCFLSYKVRGPVNDKREELITALCERAIGFAKSNPNIEQLSRLELAMSCPSSGDMPCIVEDKYLPELREIIDTDIKMAQSVAVSYLKTAASFCAAKVGPKFTDKQMKQSLLNVKNRADLSNFSHANSSTVTKFILDILKRT